MKRFKEMLTEVKITENKGLVDTTKVKDVMSLLIKTYGKEISKRLVKQNNKILKV